MPLMVARPYKHPKTGIYWLRRGVPLSLRSLVGKREEKFSLGTRDPAEARSKATKALAELDERWANLRAGNTVLTEREANELAKPLYSKWLALHQDDPGNQLTWQSDLYDRLDLLSDPKPISQGSVGARELAGREFVDTVALETVQLKGMRTFAHAQGRFILEAHGMRVDDYSYLKLVRACAIALQRASVILAHASETGEPVEIEDETAEGGEPTVSRRASPGMARPAAARTAASPVGRAGVQNQVLSLTGLLDAWWSEAKAAGRKPSTFENYRNTVSVFVAFLGHNDANQVTDADVVGFKDHRLSTPSRRTGKVPSAKTVKDGDLSALKTLFGWAVTNRKLATNPAAGITIKLGTPPKLRSKGFSDTEAEAILAAALHLPPSGDAPQLRAAKRWVPWLCAFTGARVGELAQLRREDIVEKGGCWVLRITPEAGTVKTNEAREVVLHSQLIDSGFPAFVAAAPSGHLFLSPRRDGDVLKPLQTVKNRLAEFSRALVPDLGVAPNHGWRHRFTTVALEVGIPSRVLNAIQGHAPRSVADSYGDVTLKTMADAIGRLPRF